MVLIYTSGGRWTDKDFQHLQLVGLYWLAKEINGAADFELIRQVS